jgi:hypothetical protein
MRFGNGRILAPKVLVAGAFVLTLGLMPGVVQAQEKTFVMKVTTPTPNDGDDVSKSKPAVRAAYEIVADAASRTRSPPSQ